MSQAAIAAYFLLQNILGTAVLLFLFLASLLCERVSRGASAVSGQAIAPTLIALAVSGTAILWIVHQPQDALRLSAWRGTVCDTITSRLLGRSFRCRQRLCAATENLQEALALGGSTGSRLLKGLFYSSWTIIGDIISLHLVAIALTGSSSFFTTVIAYGIKDSDVMDNPLFL